MNSHIAELIKEHDELIARIKKLENETFDSIVIKVVDKVEFANKCIQLTSMKKYAECLEARLANLQVVIDEGNYYEKVATTGNPVINCNCGSDFDKDTETLCKSSKNE